MSESQPTPTLDLQRPRFLTPPHLRSDPLPENATIEDGESPRPGESPDDRPEAGGSPRETTSSRESSPGRPRGVVQEELKLALTGALVIGVVAVGWLLRRPGRRLRHPLKSDYDAVAAPVSRIIVRHVPVELASGVGASIYDASLAAGAFMAYAERGPLLERDVRRTSTPQPEPERTYTATDLDRGIDVDDAEARYNATHGFKDEAP